MYDKLGDASGTLNPTFRSPITLNFTRRCNYDQNKMFTCHVADEKSLFYLYRNTLLILTNIESQLRPILLSTISTIDNLAQNVNHFEINQ